MNYTPIGRVRPIHRGAHDPSAAYEALDVVRRADGLASYMAKQAVPAGKTLVDGEYWGLLSDAGIKAIADAFCAPFEASGSVAECHPVAGYPLEVRSGIEPVQSGSGDPSPDNVRPITGWTGAQLTRCGKNLCPGFESGGYDNNIGITFDSSSYYRTKKIPITEGATYTHSSSKGWDPTDIHFWDKNGAHLGRYTSISVLNNRPAGAAYVAFNYYQQEITWVQLELGSTATAYEPYQGGTFTVDFGQTVYGGTLDWNTGVLTVDTAVRVFDGTEAWQYTTSDVPRFGAGTLMGQALASLNASSHFKAANSLADAQQNGNGIKIYDTGYIDIVYPSISNLDDFKSFLSAQYTAGTPVQVVYKLAAPTTIQLTPQEIAALEGLNTLYSSTGGTAVAGRTDMGWQTQGIMDRLAALESAAVNG